LNILFAADVSIKKVLGGAERVLLEQTKRLSERGHEIHVITRGFPFHASPYENIKNIHEWRYVINEKNAFTFLVSTVLNCQKLYKRISQKISLDLINLHQPFSAFAINLLRNSRQTKRVYTCLSLASEEYKIRSLKTRNLFNTPIFYSNIFFRRFMEKFSLSKCERVIVLSQFTQDKLINTHSIPKEKITIIPGGVDLGRFRPSLNKMEIRKRLHIPADKFVLLTVRNLVPRMGLENLVEAIGLIQNKIDIYLIIGGEGILRRKLQELIKKLNLGSSVELHGFVSEEDLPLYYQMADLFILPTVALEGFGLITVEAMACGLPVLGTPIGATPEILSKFDPTFIFKDTSPMTMADLIIKKHRFFMDNPEGYQKISQGCRGFVEANYSWEKNIDGLETLFQSLVEGRKRIG